MDINNYIVPPTILPSSNLFSQGFDSDPLSQQDYLNETWLNNLLDNDDAASCNRDQQERRHQFYPFSLCKNSEVEWKDTITQSDFNKDTAESNIDNGQNWMGEDAFITTDNWASFKIEANDGNRELIKSLNVAINGPHRLSYDPPIPKSPLIFWTKQDLTYLKELVRLHPSSLKVIKALEWAEAGKDNPTFSKCRYLELKKIAIEKQAESKMKVEELNESKSDSVPPNKPGYDPGWYYGETVPNYFAASNRSTYEPTLKESRWWTKNEKNRTEVTANSSLTSQNMSHDAFAYSKEIFGPKDQDTTFGRYGQRNSSDTKTESKLLHAYPNFGSYGYNGQKNSLQTERLFQEYPPIHGLYASTGIEEHLNGLIFEPVEIQESSSQKSSSTSSTSSYFGSYYDSIASDEYSAQVANQDLSHQIDSLFSESSTPGNEFNHFLDPSEEENKMPGSSFLGSASKVGLQLSQPALIPSPSSVKATTWVQVLSSETSGGRENEIIHLDNANTSACEGIYRQHRSKPRSIPKKVEFECVFCKGNNQTEEVYKTHPIRINDIVICPYLRNYVCAICKATGDNAHTIKYCPYNKRGFFAMRDNFPPPGKSNNVTNNASSSDSPAIWPTPVKTKPKTSSKLKIRKLNFSDVMEGCNIITSTESVNPSNSTSSVNPNNSNNVFFKNLQQIRKSIIKKIGSRST